MMEKQKSASHSGVLRVECSHLTLSNLRMCDEEKEEEKEEDRLGGGRKKQS